MGDWLPTVTVALATGLGYLSLRHHKQFVELAHVLLVLSVSAIVVSFFIGATIDFVLMELKYEIPKEERSESIANVEKWQSIWWKAMQFSIGASIYIGVLLGISHSVENERNPDLNSNGKTKDDEKIPESD